MQIAPRNEGWIAAAGLVTGWFAPIQCHADGMIYPQAGLVVDAGWDLLHTVQGSSASTMEISGVPLGTFDFGAPVGIQTVGVTDTIIQRLTPADLSWGSATVGIKVVALQLQDIYHNPYFLDTTLDNSGTLSITLASGTDGGTWENDFTVHLIGGAREIFHGTGTWSATPQPGTLLIPGVNEHPLGNSDFYMTQTGTHLSREGSTVEAIHQVHTVIPETSGFFAGALLLIPPGMSAIRGRLTNRKMTH